jgi:flagellar biosynthesis regulator FlaF
VFVELDARHLGAVAKDGACLHGAVAKLGVERGSVDLPRMRWQPRQRFAEVERAQLSSPLADELRAALVQIELRVRRDTESVEHRQADRQQGLTDVKPRKRVFFDHEHTMRSPGQQRRHGRARRSSADDDDVPCCCVAHCGRGSPDETSRPSRLRCSRRDPVMVVRMRSQHRRHRHLAVRPGRLRSLRPHAKRGSQL